MNGKRHMIGALAGVALTIMLLPGSEAGARTSASDFQMEGSTLTAYRGTEKEVSIPDTVEVIGRSAFEDNRTVERVVIPDSVRRIDPYAFWGCSSLAEVVLGDGLSDVGDYAFAKCTGLAQIEIPSNVKSIGILAFGDCLNLQEASIPVETSRIQETAFDGCSQVVFQCEEGSAAAKFAEAFYQRRGQAPETSAPPQGAPAETAQPQETPAGTVQPQETPAGTAQPQETSEPVPEVSVEPYVPVEEAGIYLGSTQIVGNRAVVFVRNNELPVFTSDGQQGMAGAMGRSARTIPKYTIVDGRVVADQAYYGNAQLGDVTLPEGIETVGELSFARSSITSVVLPEGVERIGYGAFYHCDALGQVTLPETVVCVEPKAFAYTLWVKRFLEGGSADGAGDFLILGGVLLAYRGNGTDVNIPEGVRVIAGEVFRDHPEIERVALPNSLKVVGEGAFEGCGGLRQIHFGVQVEELKDRAFLGNAMQEVSLPSSVKKLGLWAFGDAKVTYQGAEAERTYEPSATRLSNAAYRLPAGAAGGVPGVAVSVLEGALGVPVGESFQTGETSLAGAEGSYALIVSRTADGTAMEAAFQRALRRSVPEDMVLCDLTLTDGSGIPIRKLGKQVLSVAFPVPEAFRGREFALFALDGNGQLKELPVERVEIDGIEAVRFQMDFVSMVGMSSQYRSAE